MSLLSFLPMLQLQWTCFRPQKCQVIDISEFGGKLHTVTKKSYHPPHSQGTQLFTYQDPSQVTFLIKLILTSGSVEIPFSVSCKFFKRLKLSDWCKTPIDTCNTKRLLQSLMKVKVFTHLPTGTHTEWEAQLFIWLGCNLPMPTNPHGEVKIEIVSLQAKITMGSSQSPYTTLRGYVYFPDSFEMFRKLWPSACLLHCLHAVITPNV